jgi:alginate O-acetyltransferase complex protein AlgI
MVFMYSPGGFVACSYLLLVPLLGKSVFKRFKNIWVFWIFITLALVPLVGLRLWFEQSFFLTFGVAFATVKTLGMVLVAYGGRTEITFRNASLLIFFFPLFTVGPVEQLSKFSHVNFMNNFKLTDFLSGVYRTLIGLFLIMFICQDLLEPIRSNWFGRDIDSIINFSRVDAIGLVIISLLYTYLNFEGFSSVAIGVSKLFGLKVIENFDRPLVVTNVADFWKKYHISMGNWINSTIYFPLVIWLKKSWAPYIATVVAFILFGLWHAFNINYFVWGVGNGLGVAIVHFGRQKRFFPIIKTPSVLNSCMAITTGLISLFYVAWLQTFANLPDFQTSLTLTLKILLG